MPILELVAILFGIIFAGASLLDADWFFRRTRTKRMVQWLGSKERAQLFYAVVGLTLIGVGVASIAV